MCDTGFEADGVCVVWNESEVKARKPHWCSCCSGAIAPGTTYITHSSLYDGSWTSEKMCLPCRDARKAFVEAHRHGMTPVPSAFFTTLDECIDYGDEESERRWKPMLDAMKVRGQAVAA